MASPRAEAIIKRLRRRTPKVKGGKAWAAWDSWTYQQRRHFLRTWCQLSSTQISMFVERPYFGLNGHVKRAIKRFFRLNPVVDKTLGEMRYPERKSAEKK